MIKDAGLTLIDHEAIPIDEIDERSRSWKLCAERGPHAPVVEGYVTARDKARPVNPLSSTTCG
jgi:hypothetical protein